MFLVMLMNGRRCFETYPSFEEIPVVVAATQQQLDSAKAKVQAYLDLLKKDFKNDFGNLDLEKLKWDINNLPKPPYPAISVEFFEFVKIDQVTMVVRDVEEET